MNDDYIGTGGRCDKTGFLCLALSSYNANSLNSFEFVGERRNSLNYSFGITSSEFQMVYIVECLFNMDKDNFGAGGD